MNGNDAKLLTTDRIVGQDKEVVELALLLRQELLSRLEHLACSRSLSLCQLIRNVLHDYLARQGGGAAKPGNPP